MGWYVVKFANEDTVEAVPKSWYLKNTKECYWPPSHWTSKKINEFIKFKKTPEHDWNLYKADILGSYEDLSVAQRKTNKAKYTSELSSQNDEYRKQPNKKRKRSKSRSRSTNHLSDNDSSDVSRYESDTNNYPSTSPLITNDGNLVRNIPTEVVTKSTEYNIPRNSDTDFQKQVLKELNAIHLKLNDVMESMTLLLKNKRIQEEPTITIRDIPPIVHQFPIKNEQTLAELEEWLNADDQNKKDLIIELSRVGGLNVKDITRRIMYKVFTNEVGILYSWDGAKGKNPFKNLAISSVILGAVRYCKNTADATEAEVISFIKAWLVRCKDRICNGTKNVKNVATEKDVTMNETDTQA